jgi:2-(3-amino-3-carboxypropyl)histidine synthase
MISPEMPRAPAPATGGTARRIFPGIGPALFDALREAGHRKIVLQVPAGLTRNAHHLAAEIRRETGRPVVVLARACFGACDVPSPEEAPGADAAVVLGHAPIPNVVLPMTTYFVEMRETRGDPEALADIVVQAQLPRSLGLVASVQHLDLVEPLREALGRRGYQTRVGEGDRRLAYPAQALGCNYTGAEAIVEKVDAFLFLGTGRFHPIGLAFAVDRPVHALDPVQVELALPLDRARMIADRQIMVARAHSARRFGILVSSLVGQDRSPTARALQRKAEEHGREAEVLQFGRLDPADLVGRDFDAFVNTACPRIALDDSELYPLPMLTVPEFLMALDELPLAPYRFDTYH